MKIYELALKKGLRSPFEPADELHPATKPEEKPTEAKPGETKRREAKPGDAKDKERRQGQRQAKEKPAAKVNVQIELDGIVRGSAKFPRRRATTRTSSASAKRLLLDRRANSAAAAVAECMDIDNKGEKPETVLADSARLRVVAGRQEAAHLPAKDAGASTSSMPHKAAALGTPKAMGDSQVGL